MGRPADQKAAAIRKVVVTHSSPEEGAHHSVEGKPESVGSLKEWGKCGQELPLWSLWEGMGEAG